MQIGIIGAGAAGLVSAWLLDEQHNVTLFEKEDRLGGHAHTVEVVPEGQPGAHPVKIDAAFQFFSPGKPYTTFNRLLDVLGLRRELYSATLTLTDTAAGGQRSLVMPPFGVGWIVWPSLTPGALGTMLEFRSFLARAKAFFETQDKTLSIEDYVGAQKLPRSFVDGFLYPLLLSFWDVELADFKRFAAYSVLYYLVLSYRHGVQPPVQSDIVGGMRTYIDALEQTLHHTQVSRRAQITRVTYSAGRYHIEDASGRSHSFDHLILATNARQAFNLLAEMPHTQAVCEQLGRFQYFETTIAIHGDRRLMPPHEAHWSVVNVRWNGVHSELSIWRGNRHVPVFKSWVTFETIRPDPLYALHTYDHVKVTPDYYDAQARLKTLQGQHNLWLAGLYTFDADSHESAIRSAVILAQRLAPDSARLKSLINSL